jgi:hypothetical protein
MTRTIERMDIRPFSTTMLKEERWILFSKQLSSHDQVSRYDMDSVCCHWIGQIHLPKTISFGMVHISENTILNTEAMVVWNRFSHGVTVVPVGHPHSKDENTNCHEYPIFRSRLDIDLNLSRPEGTQRATQRATQREPKGKPEGNKSS